jgi:hypothetical protein
LALEAETRIPSNLRSQYATLGANVVAFISNLRPNNKPKIAQSWPQVFSTLTPSVKQALRYLMKKV